VVCISLFLRRAADLAGRKRCTSGLDLDLSSKWHPERGVREICREGSCAHSRRNFSAFGENMTQLTVIAHLVAKPDAVEDTKVFLLSLVNDTRSEPGGVDYDLHQDQFNPAEFTFYENWSSREAWDQHMQTPNLQAFVEKAPELFAVDPHFRLMTMVTRRP